MDAICIDCRDGKHHACVGWAYVELPDGELVERPCTCWHGAEPAELRILTVRQPWAWAILHGGKDVENRVRNIAGSYRGPVAIHVAGKYAEDIDSAALDDATERWHDQPGADCNRHPWQANVGHIIGVVDLVDVHAVQISGDGMSNVCFDDHTPIGQICSPWAQNYVEFPSYRGHHLVLANPRALDEPIPYKGALGLRRLDAETAAQVRGGLA